MKNQLTWAFAFFVLILIACKPAGTENAADTMAGDTTNTAAAAPPAEFADPKYVEIVKQNLAAFESGDVAGWMSNFADNAIYAWNYGDSLAGKTAISEYWMKRRGETIDTISFENEIFLPVKVNTPQSIEQSGVWVLAWYEVTTKYANGKSMTQWVHADTHFDANDMVDRHILYIDRQLINEALK